MKKIITLLIAVSAFTSLHAQNEPLSFNYVSDEASNILMETTDATPIGNTRIIVEFEGYWPYEAQGAFNYACRLFEAIVPETYPILIKAIWDNTTSAYLYSPVLSSCKTFYTNIKQGDMVNFEENESRIWVKGSAFIPEKHSNALIEGDNYMDNNLFQSNDAEITYYNYGSKIKNNCDFSIDTNIDSNKYDFVSIVLRDLYKVFGVDSKLTLNDEYKLQYSSEYKTFWERHILRNAGNTNFYSCLEDDGSYSLSGVNQGYSSQNINLYVPAVWDNLQTLNYIQPTNVFKDSYILTPNFGRNCVTRDIPIYSKLFAAFLGWYYDIGTGIRRLPKQPLHINVGEIINTDSLEMDSIPYYQSTTQARQTSSDIEESVYNIYEYPKPEWAYYYYTYALKKDGTYEFLGMEEDHEIDIFSAISNISIDNFARDYNGNIRVIIINQLNNTINTRAVSVPVIPQKTEIECRVDQIGNGLYRNIGIKNIEGTDSLVATIIETNGTTTSTTISNFKKGTFRPNVGLRTNARLFVTAYNELGCVNSDTISLNIEQRPRPGHDLIIGGGSISLGSNDEDDDTTITSYNITPLSNNYSSNPNGATLFDDNKIYIHNLKEGYYIVTVLTNHGEKISQQFYKK